MDGGVSTGVGGNAGGIPMQRELETTAWTEINKAALGIVADSIEKSFVEMNPRYSTGHLGGFGYKTTAGMPWLPHPLEAQRQSELSPLKSNDEEKQQVYRDIVSLLSPDLQARFAYEMNKPFEQRNLSFVALDNVLQAAAAFISGAGHLSQAAPAGSIEEARTTLNLLLPFAALKGALANGLELMGSAQTFLAEQGANYPSYDGFNNTLGQMQRALTLLAIVNESLGSTTEGQLDPKAMAAAGKAAQLLAILGSQLERVSLGPDLKFLLANVAAMEIIATALSLPNTNASSLFIALAIASIGLSTSDNTGGMLGSGYATLADSFTQTILAGLMPQNNKAGNELLSYMVPLSLAVFTGLASIAAESGLGPFPPGEPQDIDAARSFAFEIALQLAVSSGIIQTFYEEAIAASGGSPQAQDLGSSALAMLAHLFIIQSASNENKSRNARLVENEARSIKEGIISAEEIERAAESDRTVNTAIALKLASLALESKDFKGFLEAFGSYLESMGSSQSALDGDIAKVGGISLLIAAVIGQGNPDKQLTSIINIV
ncbi:MAG TPA: hypothetical protein VGP47_01105 [Parachlamydiaceae bacterium]|nr:hypothetical protein [Parachlamydiaceae bacterium]